MIRGRDVMLDRDVAALHLVDVRTLVQAVKRNRRRFPRDFVFELTPREFRIVWTRSRTKRTHGGRRTPPLVFTEAGVAMASAVLRGGHPERMLASLLRQAVHKSGEPFALIERAAQIPLQMALGAGDGRVDRFLQGAANAGDERRRGRGGDPPTWLARALSRLSGLGAEAGAQPAEDPEDDLWRKVRRLLADARPAREDPLELQRRIRQALANPGGRNRQVGLPVRLPDTLVRLPLDPPDLDSSNRLGNRLRICPRKRPVAGPVPGKDGA